MDGCGVWAADLLVMTRGLVGGSGREDVGLECGGRDWLECTFLYEMVLWESDRMSDERRGENCESCRGKYRGLLCYAWA